MECVRPQTVSSVQVFPFRVFDATAGFSMRVLFYLMTLNSAVNPWIYMIFNANLLEALCNACCGGGGGGGGNCCGGGRSSREDIQ